MDPEMPRPVFQETFGGMHHCETRAGLRYVLLTLLQTGGVPSQMAEGIADILEEAGYQDFRPTKGVALRRRKAQMLKSTAPEATCDTLDNTTAERAENPEIVATHNRIRFERLATHNRTQDGVSVVE